MSEGRECMVLDVGSMEFGELHDVLAALKQGGWEIETVLEGRLADARLRLCLERSPHRIH